MPITPDAPAASSYGFHGVLLRQDFTQAVTKVTEALETEGFGILTEIGVQARTTPQTTTVPRPGPPPPSVPSE